MKRAALYVVETNYNWPQSITRYNEQHILARQETEGIPQIDILGHPRQFDRYEGQELEARIKEERPGSMFPCIAPWTGEHLYTESPR